MSGPLSKIWFKWPMLCLPLFCANILSLYPLGFFLKYLCSQLKAYRQGFMPRRLVSLFKMDPVPPMVFLSPLCANTSSLFPLEFYLIYLCALLKTQNNYPILK